MKSIPEHYLQTGILGAYETTQINHEEHWCGKYAPCFEDAVTHFDTRKTTTRRIMDIGGRRFCVHSIFSANAKHTPTDKLLTLIDSRESRPNSC